MRIWIIGLLVVLCAVPLCAATFFGTIESVDADARTVVVQGSKIAGKKTFTIPERVRITQNSKAADFDALVEGASVSITTDGAEKVTRINVKGEPAEAPPEKPAKKPATSKSSTSKPSSSKSTAKSPASDDEPVEGKPASSRSAASKSRTSKSNGSNDAEVSPNDWPYFAGPAGDNVAQETGLLQSWPTDGPPLAWSARGLGEGYSAVAVAGGVVYTMGNVDGSETLTALNLETGDQIWQKKTAPASRLSMGNGPRGTPTYNDGRVYGLGGNGDLACLDAQTGNPVWKMNILKEFDGRNIQWGISESVLIDGDKLICTPGGSSGSVVALNKNSGKVIWRGMVPGKSPAGYSSAIVAEVGGVRQYIQFLHAGVAGFSAATGEFLWGNDSSANGTANCSSPLFADNMVFSASGYGKGGAMVKLSARGKKVTATHEYHTNKMESHHGGMVLLDGHVYGASDPGVVRCLELATGNVKWENRSVGKGAITCADGHLYVRSERGPLALIEATPTEYIEKGRFDQPDRSNAEAWAHPVVAQGKLFLRDQDLLLVYDVKRK